MGQILYAGKKNKDGSPLTSAGMTKEEVSWNLIRIPLLCKERIVVVKYLWTPA